jgi:hypothetical protein
MNSVQCEEKESKRKHKDDPVQKINVSRRWPPKWTTQHRSPSPIIVPGTPDSAETEDQSSSSLPDSTKENTSNEDLEIFYKAFAKYRPDIDESNADSAERSRLIDEEIARLQNLKEQLKQTKQENTGEYLTPEKQVKRSKIENYVQNIDIHDEYLNPNPDKPKQIEPIEIIMDTGAAMTMFPDTYPWAWRNLRQCLYSISGCFTGERHSNLQMGEFHGILTLDSGETIRVIIPESVSLP